jgi:flagellar motor switch protein FliM
VGLAPTRILALAVGDVIVLDHRVGVPMSVETNGIAITRAIAGKSGSRLAALVVDSPTFS